MCVLVSTNLSLSVFKTEKISTHVYACLIIFVSCVCVCVCVCVCECTCTCTYVRVIALYCKRVFVYASVCVYRIYVFFSKYVCYAYVCVCVSMW